MVLHIHTLPISDICAFLGGKPNEDEKASLLQHLAVPPRLLNHFSKLTYKGYRAGLRDEGLDGERKIITAGRRGVSEQGL